MYLLSSLPVCGCVTPTRSKFHVTPPNFCQNHCHVVSSIYANQQCLNVLFELLFDGFICHSACFLLLFPIVAVPTCSLDYTHSDGDQTLIRRLVSCRAFVQIVRLWLWASKKWLWFFDFLTVGWFFACQVHCGCTNLSSSCWHVRPSWFAYMLVDVCWAFVQIMAFTLYCSSSAGWHSHNRRPKLIKISIVAVPMVLRRFWHSDHETL